MTDRIFVYGWLFLAGANLLLAVSNATSHDWHQALDNFAAACIAAYVASLLDQRWRLRRTVRDLSGWQR